MIETTPIPRVDRRALHVDDRLLMPLAALGVAALAWARLPSAARHVVWAEDGARFLTELEKEGFWTTLFKPYTGYLQFWPRVLTEIAVQVPLVHFAEVVAALSCLAVGAIGGGVYAWSRAVTTQPLLRLALAAVPVCVPIAPIEVLGNLANLHWFVLWGCAWLLLQVPASRGGAIGLAALAATFALTEIQVAVLIPLFLVHLRSGRVWIVRAGLIAGIGVQAVSTLVAPRTGMPDHLGLASAVAGYFVNGPLAAIVGDPAIAGGLLADHGLWLAYAAAIPFVACAIAAVVLGRAIVRVAVPTLLLTSVVTWFAAIWMNVGSAFVPMFGYATFSSGQLRTMSFYRYGFVPGLCLLAVVLIAVGVLLDRRRDASTPGLARRVIGAGLLAVLVVVVLSSFSVPKTLRDGQPLWQSSFAAAVAVCRAHPETATAQVAEAPATWAADLPCRVLSR